MSDTQDELDAIRERKRERLEAKLRDDDSGALDATEAGGDTGPSTPSEPIHVESAAHFQDVVSDYDTVLADFYADWCGPCEMLAPIVEEVAAETPAAVAKVDSGVHRELTSTYGVRGLPTLLLFAGGDVVERRTGVQQKGQIRTLIDRYA